MTSKSRIWQRSRWRAFFSDQCGITHVIDKTFIMSRNRLQRNSQRKTLVVLFGDSIIFSFKNFDKSSISRLLLSSVHTLLTDVCLFFSLVHGGFPKTISPFLYCIHCRYNLPTVCYTIEDDLRVCMCYGNTAKKWLTNISRTVGTNAISRLDF